MNRQPLVSRADAIAELGWNDGVILLALDSPHCVPVLIEGSARLLWQSVGASPRDVDEIVAEVAAAYELTPADLESDVVAFYDRLRAHGLIRSVEQAATPATD